MENMQFPALSLRGQIYHLQMHPSSGGQSNKGLQQELGPNTCQGFTCHTHGAARLRTAAKAVRIFPAAGLCRKCHRHV